MLLLRHQMMEWLALVRLNKNISQSDILFVRIIVDSVIVTVY